MSEDYVMSPDTNATVYLNTGLSVGSQIKLRLEHVKVEYFEEIIRVNQLHEIPTHHVDRIVRDAGERTTRNYSRSKSLNSEDCKSLGDYT